MRSWAKVAGRGGLRELGGVRGRAGRRGPHGAQRTRSSAAASLSSAGESFFAQEAFGRRGLALLVGWVVLCSGILSLATVSVAFAGYMSSARPRACLELGGHRRRDPLRCLRRDQLSAACASPRPANIVATLVELTGSAHRHRRRAALFIGAARRTRVFRAVPSSSSVRRSVGEEICKRGAALGFFAFIGFEDMVNVAEEVKDPEPQHAARNPPRARWSTGIDVLCWSSIVATTRGGTRSRSPHIRRAATQRRGALDRRGARRPLHTHRPLRRREYGSSQLHHGLTAHLRHVATGPAPRARSAEVHADTPHATLGDPRGAASSRSRSRSPAHSPIPGGHDEPLAPLAGVLHGPRLACSKIKRPTDTRRTHAHFASPRV